MLARPCAGHSNTRKVTGAFCAHLSASRSFAILNPEVHHA